VTDEEHNTHNFAWRKPCVGPGRNGATTGLARFCTMSRALCKYLLTKGGI